MLLKSRVAKHVLPEHVEMHATRLSIYKNDPETRPGQPSYEMVQVALKEIPAGVEYGFPKMYAIVHGPNASTLQPFPVPDKDYHARFRYCPMAKEI